MFYAVSVSMCHDYTFVDLNEMSGQQFSFRARKEKNADLPTHEVFDSLRSQRHRNRQTRGLPHIMRIAG